MSHKLNLTSSFPKRKYHRESIREKKKNSKAVPWYSQTVPQPTPQGSVIPSLIASLMVQTRDLLFLWYPRKGEFRGRKSRTGSNEEVL